MRKNEKTTPKKTRDAVMTYLAERLGTQAGYVSYLDIAHAINKSRHAVAFAVEKLIRAHELTAYDKKLEIVNLEKWLESG